MIKFGFGFESLDDQQLSQFVDAGLIVRELVKIICSPNFN